MTDKRKKIVGITGGVGAGKSSVLKILEEKFHARVILADLVAHELMEPGSEGLKRIVAALGDGFLSADGAIDKKAFSELIFQKEEAREAVNDIIHPLTWQRILEEAKKADETLIVVEAAIFDSAPEGFFDELWYVSTTRENRIRRLMETRGYSLKKCESIMAAQESEEDYKRRCKRIIDNNGSEEELEQRLEEILGHEVC